MARGRAIVAITRAGNPTRGRVGSALVIPPARNHQTPYADSDSSIETLIEELESA